MATVPELANFFWRHFTKEYLPSLTERKKWKEKKQNFREGDQPRGYSAYSDRRVQETNHKTLLVRGSVRLEL